MAYKLSILVLCFIYSFGVAYIFTPIVEVSGGKLRGLYSLSGQNRYYGIPYAVSDRFQVRYARNGYIIINVLGY